MGEATPIAAHGLAGRSASIAPIYGNVFDHHTVVYEYSNGAVMYGLVRTQHGCHGEVAVKLFGTKGRAWEGGIDGETKWRYNGPNAGGHQIEQTEFLAALRAGKTINNGDYMARSTMISILGQLACYTGRKITWKQASDSKFAYQPPDDRIDFTIDPPVKAGPDGLYPVPVPGKTDWV
jgi:hypothetical protein